MQKFLLQACIQWILVSSSVPSNESTCRDESSCLDEKVASNARNLLACGNPGSGKSTLLNSLIGEAKFQSGFNLGEGMTFQFEKHYARDGITYMDTPGLADKKMRKQAADAISEALRSGGFYKLVFVLTLEAGRVKEDDATTMRLILDSTQDILDYGIIFNKVSKKVASELNDPKKMEHVLDVLYADSSLPRSNKVFVMGLDLEIMDENNVLMDEKRVSGLRTFLRTISDEPVQNVEPIKWNEFDEVKEQRDKAKEQVITMQAKIEESENREKVLEEQIMVLNTSTEEQKAMAQKAQADLDAERKTSQRLMDDSKKLRDDFDAERTKANAARISEQRLKDKMEEEERVDKELRKHGGCRNCEIEAVSDLHYISDGSHCVSKGTKGVMKVHVGWSQGANRVHIDWSNGKSSSTAYHHVRFR